MLICGLDLDHSLQPRKEYVSGNVNSVQYLNNDHPCRRVFETGTRLLVAECPNISGYCCPTPRFSATWGRLTIGQNTTRSAPTALSVVVLLSSLSCSWLFQSSRHLDLHCALFMLPCQSQCVRHRCDPPVNSSSCISKSRCML